MEAILSGWFERLGALFAGLTMAFALLVLFAPWLVRALYEVIQ